MFTSITGTMDLWNKFWKCLLVCPMNLANDFMLKANPKFRIEIERTTSMIHEVDADSIEDAVDKAFRMDAVSSKTASAQKSVRTHVYRKNDADGYDLVTGLRGDA